MQKSDISYAEIICGPGDAQKGLQAHVKFYDVTLRRYDVAWRT